MKVSPHATRSHLLVGVILVVIALACAIAGLAAGQAGFGLLVFFFGVWGGVETGRYLEAALRIREG